MSKPTTRTLPLVLGLVASGALALTALSARSQTPTGSPSAYPSAAPSAPAAASSSGTAGAVTNMTNLLRGADIPTEPSDAPKEKKDWEAGVTVSPNDGVSTACTFRRLREWLRIDCDSRIGGALIAGEPTDVKVWSWGDPIAPVSSEARKNGVPMPTTVIVFPLRRGESKIFDLSETESGWDWVGPSSAERISLAWRDSSPDPVLIVNARH